MKTLRKELVSAAKKVHTKPLAFSAVKASLPTTRRAFSSVAQSELIPFDMPCPQAKTSRVIIDE